MLKNNLRTLLVTGLALGCSDVIEDTTWPEKFEKQCSNAFNPLSQWASNYQYHIRVRNPLGIRQDRWTEPHLSHLSSAGWLKSFCILAVNAINYKVNTSNWYIKEVFYKCLTLKSCSFISSVSPLTASHTLQDIAHGFKLLAALWVCVCDREHEAERESECVLVRCSKVISGLCEALWHTSPQACFRSP